MKVFEVGNFPFEIAFEQRLSTEPVVPSQDSSEPRSRETSEPPAQAPSEPRSRETSEPHAQAPSAPPSDASPEPIYPTNVTLDTPNGKKITIESRQVDGFLRKTGIFRAWESEYFAKKAMAEVIRDNGFAKKDVYGSERKYGAWLAPILARAMARKAGLSESEIEGALRPEGVEPYAVQPQLEGRAGNLLTTARKVRPGVSGHVNVREFVQSLDGMVLRAHGRYMDASVLLNSVGKQWSHFLELPSNTEFFEALVKKRGVPCSDLIIFETISGVVNTPEKSEVQQNPKQFLHSIDPRQLTGLWVDFGLGVKLATWANKRFEVEVCDLVVRYMTSQVTSDELDATRTLLASHQAGNEAGDAQSDTQLQRPDPRCSVRARRACLGPIPDLPPMYVPIEITSKPGGYLGVLGAQVVEDDEGGGYEASIKVGETKQVYGRWNGPNGHISTSPNAQLFWAATPRERGVLHTLWRTTLGPRQTSWSMW